jgi:hypothetical protein
LRVTAVTSNRERSYTLHIAAGLSLLTAAVLEACACKRIDLARNRFLMPPASPSAEQHRLTKGKPQQHPVRTAQPTTPPTI